MLSLLAASVLALANPSMTGDEIAAQIAARPSDDDRTGRITFILRDKKGRERERSARMAISEAEGTNRMLLLFDSPANIRDTAFLNHDQKGANAPDETWLFLPSTEQVRQIPTSDRSDRFMATELTYGDVQDDFKFEVSDYLFEAGPPTNDRVVLLGTAKSDAAAKETGYGSFRAEIDPETWFPRLIDFAGPDGSPLKTITVHELKQVGASWTAQAFEVVNHQTGRSTVVRVEDTRTVEGFEPGLFDATRLDRAGLDLP